MMYSGKVSISILILLVAALTFVWLGVGGCADFFDEKSTEIQSENILRELSRIRVLPDPNVIEPAVYQVPPRITVEKDCAKLFYFVRNHTVDTLSALVTQQFPPPPPPAIATFQVSQVPATNQLIVRCPTADDANAVLSFIQEVDVKPIQVRIDCVVSELYADVTMDWETTLLIQNLFGEGIKLGGKTDAAGEVMPAFPGASIRDNAREQIGLKVGIDRGVEGHKFLALIDMLVSRGYLKILLSPSLEVVNGQTAMISASDHVPLPKEVRQGDNFFNVTDYVDVVDSLQITPHVFADGFIGLETKAITGSKSTPEGVKQIPIITKRDIENKENRIRQGESLIIGGLKKTEKRSVVRGVPFLKDIPIIGILFSSKDFEERGKEVLFIITPTLSQGGVDQAQMVEELIRKHEPNKNEPTWRESLLDPLGFQSKTEERMRVSEQAENDRINAQRLKARAEKAENENRKIQMLKEQAAIEESKAQQLKTQHATAQAEAQRTRAAADKAAADSARAAAEAERASKEADQEKARQAVEEAQKAAAQAKRTEAEAAKAKAVADQAAAASREATSKAEAEKAVAEAEAAKAQAEAQKAIAEAEAAKAEAEKARVESIREAARLAAMAKAREANDPNGVRAGNSVSDVNAPASKTAAVKDPNSVAKK